MKLKVLNTVGLIAVVYINYLANALPINGYNTGELSSFYPNLFVPAGITFSIWGIIYLFLVGFVIAQWLPQNSAVISKIGYSFLFSCILNISWILAWHYRYVGVSVIIMILLLTAHIILYQRTRFDTKILSQKLFLKTPFSIYIGWISVATIANITALLVHLDFNPSHPEYWAAAMILITQFFVWIFTDRYKDLVFVGVIVWAICGIILKQTNLNGPSVIILVSYISIVMSLAFSIRSLVKRTTN